MDAYLTAREVALLLKLSVQTIRRYTMNKEIPFHKINRAVRFKQSEIEIWFEKRQAEKARSENSNTNTEQGGGLFGGAGVAAGENAGGETAAAGGETV